MHSRHLLAASTVLALALLGIGARRTSSEYRLAPVVVRDSAAAPDAAQIVGAGVVSTRDYEQNSSFSADERTIYFSKRTIWPTTRRCSASRTWRRAAGRSRQSFPSPACITTAIPL